MKYDSILFELSWEVCNKIGGIYTVIESKTPYLENSFNQHYLVGPYVENSKNFFEEKLPELEYIDAMKELEEMGIKVHFGTTNIQGERKVILIEHLGYSQHLNEIKSSLWENHKIDSLNSNWYDYDEAILWSWCCGIVIEKLTQSLTYKILVQAHEWMSGGSIFYLTSLNNDKYRTIFTTHATMLGRSISGSGMDMYDLKNKINPEKFAYELGVQTKHQTEKSLANISNCFTTVSDFTNTEADFFYSKSADVILYNGFDNTQIKDINLLNQEYNSQKEKINEFILGYFNDSYKIDMQNTKLLYTSGRNEFRNKGFDIYIKSLSQLNQKLKEENSNLTIINFFLVMVNSYSPNDEIISSISNYNNHIENTSDYAPLSTHNITEHEILSTLKENNLKNFKDDKVKNIFVPMDLNGKDGVINQKYFDFIRGFDLSIFASYYEPWGYTPLESISFAIPTITTDLTGFGQNILNHYGNSTSSVMVLKRAGIDDTTATNCLTNQLYNQVKQNKNILNFQRSFTKNLALNYDWSKFIPNYYKAFDLALLDKKS
jgi:phosphorylase/glycogen(starch) synthase